MLAVVMATLALQNYSTGGDTPATPDAPPQVTAYLPEPQPKPKKKPAHKQAASGILNSQVKRKFDGGGDDYVDLRSSYRKHP